MEKNYLYIGMAILTVFIISIIIELSTLNSEENKFIGSWRDGTGQIYEFKNSFLSKTIEITTGGMTFIGNWKIDNDVLFVDYTINGINLNYKYIFSFNENKILLEPYGGFGFGLTLIKI